MIHPSSSPHHHQDLSSLLSSYSLAHPSIATTMIYAWLPLLPFAASTIHTLYSTYSMIHILKPKRDGDWPCALEHHYTIRSRKYIWTDWDTAAARIRKRNRPVVKCGLPARQGWQAHANMPYTFVIFNFQIPPSPATKAYSSTPVTHGTLPVVSLCMRIHAIARSIKALQ
jgi:hypothetical protein